MKRRSQQQFAQIKVSSLSQCQKESFLTFLATSHEVRMDAAQFGYGGTIALEVVLPASSLAQWVSPQPNDSPTPSGRESRHSPEKKKVMPSSGLAEPTTGAMEKPPDPPRRSCQWVHKLMEDVLAFRARQFQFEVQAILTPLNSSIGGTVREQQALVRKHISARTTPSTDDLSVAIFKFLTKKFGVMSMVKSASSDLLHAIRFYRSSDLDIQLFGVLLSSSAYDTLDVLKYIKWRSTLYPYLIYQQEPTSVDMPTVVTRSFVKVCDIPALVRKCLIDRSENSEHDIEEQEPLWLRVRSAYESWCDPLGRFPGIVADPNFYCPPFRTTNPYVGRPLVGESEGAVRHRLLAQEGRFAKFDNRCVVHTAQLLTLLVLCWKEERLFPHNWISSTAAASTSRGRARTPPPSRPSAASPVVSTRPQSPVSTHRSASQEHVATTKSIRASAASKRATSAAVTLSPASRSTPLNISAIRGGGTSVNESLMSPGAAPRDVTANGNEVHLSATSANSPGGQCGASPTLRQEEEQFLRDMRSLESRLLKAVTVRRV